MAWIGPIGSLVHVKCPSGLQAATERPSSYRTTLGGVRKAQQAPRVLRQLEVSHGLVRPADIANLAALVGGEYGPGPFWYVDPWAEVTNLLAPQASLLEPGTWSSDGAAVLAGPVRLADGSIAGRSVTPATPSESVRFPWRGGFSDRLPVVQGQRVTASVYALGAAVTIRIHWVNAAGEAVGTSANTTALPGGEPTRLSVTGPPPPTAMSMYVSVQGATRIARPAVTWTDSVLPWLPGQGMPRVSITGLELSTILAHRGKDGRMATASFTVTEVG